MLLRFCRKKLWPCMAVIGVIAVAVWQLHRQGRLWLCASVPFHFWVGDVWSPENSQQLFDPYSLTHLLHGCIMYGLLVWIVPRVPLLWRLWLAVCFEALWELVENTECVIERYRGVTAAIGYHGDTIINSLGDIFFFGIGFVMARYLGLRRTVVVFVIIELLLLVWIRDGLILNMIMLLCPIDAVKEWQTGL